MPSRATQAQTPAIAFVEEQKMIADGCVREHLALPSFAMFNSDVFGEIMMSFLNYSNYCVFNIKKYLFLLLLLWPRSILENVSLTFGCWPLILAISFSFLFSPCLNKILCRSPRPLCCVR